jgi:uncharacterized protein YjbI with pentapeptide repeats
MSISSDITTLVVQIKDKYAAGVRNFAGVQLVEADLSDCNLSGVNFSHANLSGANLSGANLKETSFESTTMEGANLAHANLEETSLTKTKLQDANLDRANLVKAKLIGAYLEHASLYRANLTQAFLTISHLNEVNAIEANFTEASLNGTRLQKSLLNGANLTGAVFNKTQLQGANLAGANLSNLDFTSAETKGTLYDKTTTFDDNFDPKQMGMKQIPYFQLFLLEQVSITEILQEFNRIIKSANHYVGPTIARRYLESARPKSDWFDNFQIDMALGEVIFTGSGNEVIDREQIIDYYNWLNQFLVGCSHIIQDFGMFIENKA